MDRQFSKGKSAAKARCNADKSSKYYSDRLEDKAVTKRLIPMMSVKSLASKFY